MAGFKASLPDCRAYEMVTPPYKEGFQIGAGSAVSEDGSQIMAESLGGLLSPGGTIPEGSGTFGHFYRLVRAEAGWESLPLEAPFSRLPNLHEVPSIRPDFGSSIWIASAQGQTSEDVYLDQSNGAVTHVGPGAPPGNLERALILEGSSKDLDHLVLGVNSANGEEENPLWPGDQTLAGGLPSLYQYAGTGNAEPELVGVSNQTSVSEAAQIQGAPHINEAAKLISDCGTFLGGGLPETEAYNAVSATGAEVFFTSKQCAGGPPVDELYARIEGEKTIAISEPPLSVPGRQCATTACMSAESVPGNRQAGVFVGASLDGSRVFFMTAQPLVDGDTDSSTDLYAAELSKGAVTRLIQVSGGGSGDPTPGSGAEVLGVARISEDGSHVYFVARGALTGTNREGKAPVTGEPNLYVAVDECAGGESTCEDPVERTSFIATLSGADGGDWNPTDKRPVQATPDGRFLVFQSTADLTPDQKGLPEAGQVFQYDAQTETLVRVSRGENGYGDDGNSSTYAATIPREFYNLDQPDRRFARLAVSSDGSRVFFTSAAALTPQVTAGFSGVYEYHGGQVALIAAGHDVTEPNATSLVGTDESGQDVFFETTDQLLSQDRDVSPDVYDARSDGGFTPPPAEAAPCAGDSCQGAANAPPVLATPGLAGLSEGGAPPPPADHPSSPKSATRAQKLAKALKACRKKQPGRKRAGCVRQAQQRYGRSK